MSPQLKCLKAEMTPELEIHQYCGREAGGGGGGQQAGAESESPRGSRR